MKYIVIDLEMNEISKKFKQIRKTMNMEIIEIGAVLLNEEFEIQDEFQCLIKPQYNEITRRCRDLTHITNEMVEKSVNYEEGMTLFFEWIGDNKDIEIYSWSETDAMQFMNESLAKNIHIDKAEFILDRWKDLQAEFGDIIGMQRQVSLKHACEWTGIDFEGQQHRALDDAINTSKILAYCNNEEEFHENIEPISNLFNNNKRLTCSIGDLFPDNFFENIVFR